MVGYQVLAYLTKEDTERLNDQSARGTIAAMIDADRKNARLHGVAAGREVSFAMPAEFTGMAASQGAMETRLKGLEKEVAELKGLLKQAIAARG